MSDSYQAVFDAVRSKIGHVDIGEAISNSMREANIGHYFEMTMHEAQRAVISIEEELTRPSAIYKPAIRLDGNKWCALYGEDLQCGVAGFGDSPAQAMDEFDKEWRKNLACTGSQRSR